MRDPMTQRFVTAFLTTCFENGLSKEAAAQLLQRESLVQELDARPAFAVGYLAKVASFPGQMRAMLSPRDLSELQKSAARRPPKIGAFKQMGEGIKGVFGGASRAAAAAPAAIGRGAGYVVGKPRNTTSLMSRYPRTSTVTGLGLAGGGYKWWNRDDALGGDSLADPFLPPGITSEDAYEKKYEAELGLHEPSIFGMNKSRGGYTAEVARLRDAIASGRGGESAYYQLRELERAREGSDKKFDETTEQLDKKLKHSNDMMERIATRKADLENQRTAWWAPLTRWGAAAREGDWRGPFASSGAVQRGMDHKIGPLQDNLARHQMIARLAKDRARMLRGDATGRNSPPRSGQQLTRDFFPTY